MFMEIKKVISITYSEAIRIAFIRAFKKDKSVFAFGQGLWSPWYVGNTMKDLDKIFGKDRIIDTPVSESASTGLCVGASIFGTRAISIHPRMDFLLYAMDSIINHAAKWRYMFGNQSNCKLTIRAIINRGGEQGPQHSQLLNSFFSHVPGINVLLPATPQDAYDFLLASIFDNNPCIYIDDKWLYDIKDNVKIGKKIKNINEIKPKILSKGKDITIVSSGYTTNLSLLAKKNLIKFYKINPEIIDLRIVNPIKMEEIIKSVKKTKRILCVENSWPNCSISSEIISRIVETVHPKILKSKPKKISLPLTPAPTSQDLEKIYYISVEQIIKSTVALCKL